MPDQPRQAPRSRLRWLPGSARGFDLPIGPSFGSTDSSGYYIDFRSKAPEPIWEESRWARAGARFVWVALIQWALGAYERFLAEGDERWLRLSLRASDHLIAAQEPDGRFRGGWVHAFPLRHTHPLRPPWLSAMAQGEGASLLLRMHDATGEERYIESALAALAPMERLPEAGGVRGTLDGGFFPEEYPTDPPSHVLNGGIFALWGCHDLSVRAGDRRAGELAEEGFATLARAISRFDTGSWSRYDLFPGPVTNLASPAYHDLHISQLAGLASITGEARLQQAAERFQQYGASRMHTARAVAHKAWFRVMRPRNPMLATLAPWTRAQAITIPPLVLCYHAISETWDSPLSVTPAAFERQIRSLRNAGLRGVTFTEASRCDSYRTVAITFDDAFRSVFELAEPILSRYGFPATVFAPTEHVGRSKPMAWRGVDQWRDSPHARELLPMSWEQLARLRDSGWEIGSHTRGHPWLTHLGDEDLATELAESRRAVEAGLGGPCRTLAYPYGDHDYRVVTAARRAGYELAGTLPARPVWNGDPLRFPRVGIYRRDHHLRFRLKISPLVRRARTRLRRRERPS